MFSSLTPKCFFVSSDADLIHFERELKNNFKDISDLSLKFEEVTCFPLSECFSALAKNQTIKIFSLRGFYSFLDSEKLAQAVEKDKVEQLCYTRQVSNIYDLAATLTKNASIEVLNLNDNNFDDSDTLILVDKIKHNKALRVLNLDNNQITDVKIFIELLKNNSHLQSLSIRKAKLDPKAVDELLNYIEEHNFCIETLNFDFMPEQTERWKRLSLRNHCFQQYSKRPIKEKGNIADFEKISYIVPIMSVYLKILNCLVSEAIRFEKLWLKKKDKKALQKSRDILYLLENEYDFSDINEKTIHRVQQDFLNPKSKLSEILHRKRGMFAPKMPVKVEECMRAVGIVFPTMSQ